MNGWRAPGPGSARFVPASAEWVNAASATRTTRAAAFLILTTLTAVWAIWASREGAFFGAVFYPGAIGLCLLVILLLAYAPWRGRLALSPGAVLAVCGLGALSAWTLLSALWSPAADTAIEDGLRVLTYGIAFGSGLWVCNLLRGRLALSMAPLAIAGGVAGIVALVTVLSGDDLARYLEGDGTLRYPLGYRNANAAFFLIAVWPAIAVAAMREHPAGVRALMLGSATLCVNLALMSQSRGSVPAAALALAVFVLVSPQRLRALAWTALAAIPAALAIPWTLDVYAAVQDGAPVLPALRDAARAAAISSGAAVVLGALAAAIDARLRPSHPREPADRDVPSRGRAMVAVGATLVALALAAPFIAAADPVGWVAERAEEFRAGGAPDLSQGSSRFGANATSDRYDLWRVAWSDARAEPILGLGAGGFQYSYLEDRDAEQSVLDAHSVEFELLSELGFPGLAFLVLALLGAGWAALRSCSLGASAAWVSAAALAGGAYWLMHASLDWFWAYPAVTAPVFALLGAAAAPAVFDPASRPRARSRLALGVAVAAIALVMVPAYMSERYTNSAYDGWRADLDGAYSDLGRARDLNPLAEDPLLAEGEIARQSGDRARAEAAFRRAIDRKPELWASHYLLGLVLAEEDPEGARRELVVAQRLNPLSADVRRALKGLDPAEPARRG